MSVTDAKTVETDKLHRMEIYVQISYQTHLLSSEYAIVFIFPSQLLLLHSVFLWLFGAYRVNPVNPEPNGFSQH